MRSMGSAHLPPTSGCPVSGLVKPSLPVMPRIVPKMRADSGKLAGPAFATRAAGQQPEGQHAEQSGSSPEQRIAGGACFAFPAPKSISMQTTAQACRPPSIADLH